MRGTIGRTVSNPNIQYLASLTKRNSFLLQSSPFSSSFSSGDGRGRGRNSPLGGFTSAIGKSDSEDKRRDSNESHSFGLGHGRGWGNSPFGVFTSAIEKSDSEDKRRDSTESPSVGSGHGRGRVTPLSSEPKLPSFSSHDFQNGSGRGRVTNEPVPPPPPRQPKLPIFIMKQDEIEADSSARAAESVYSREPTIPSSIPSAASLFGAGQGKPAKQPEPVSQMKEENRHIEKKQEQQRPPPSPPVSKEEAVKKAMDILSRRREGDEREGMSMSGGRGSGRGGGRGAQRGRGRGRGRVQEGYTRTEEEAVKEIGDDLYLGDNASGEKLAETIGAENMAKLVEGFEELSSRVLPSPHDDAYLEAMHTNFMIEFEPEYLMANFETNPDIDEKPPMSLRDALEKVKPFLMSYEGIQNQEEWEEAIKETMENVPLLQEIIDHYSGPDRVTAKKQQEELERVAKTLPKSAPASVKNFANRAVLSLQSNPGWGFDKKCQFMDKLVWEVSQQYK